LPQFARAKNNLPLSLLQRSSGRSELGFLVLRVGLASFRAEDGNISQAPQFYSLEVIDMAIALWWTGVNPFDPKTMLLAKHAQHVVLIHFPIALFIAAVIFDLIAQWTKRGGLADAAYYNLLGAAITTLPVLATGILAWHYQLEGQKLKGTLLQHLVLACLSTAMIWLVWWVSFRARQRAEALPSYRIAIEFLAVAAVMLTGHLGGFLSGVNGPG
jgi:uncharacterized membrane protein